MTAQFDFSALTRPFEADWPVSVNVPQDGGEVKAVTFMARFRLIKDKELKAVIEAEGFTLQDLPRAFFVGFGKGVTQEFSPELREEMIATPWVRLGLQDAYQKFSQGIAAKN